MVRDVEEDGGVQEAMLAADEAVDEREYRAPRRREYSGIRCSGLMVVVICSALFAGASVDRLLVQRTHRHRGGFEVTCDDQLGRRHLNGRRRTAELMCTKHVEKSNVQPLEDAKIALGVIGDWGRDGFCCQHDVAFELDKAMRTLAAKAIVSTGDNFYDEGVQGVADEQIQTSWRSVYVNPFKSTLPWFVVLGNHDRYGSARAQMELSDMDSMWHLPSEKYVRRLREQDVQVDLFFFDTNALFYSDDEHLERLNLTGDDGGPQLEWLRASLKKSTAAWKVVVGHHPVFSTGIDSEEVPNMEKLRTRVKSVLDEGGATCYFNGHAHNLQHYEVSGVHYFTSGAGSKLKPLVGDSKDAHFGVATQGFMTSSFSAERMRAEFVDYLGEVIYSVDIELPSLKAENSQERA
mmetsp:Transcript_2002/g.5988  ORF Transcript_2002/g.5988 Transcript_2002/m.5988 type:complete len:406 (-) Transcript_2002:1403-2620(-)